jgi:hypothetical protein
MDFVVNSAFISFASPAPKEMVLQKVFQNLYLYQNHLPSL